MLCSATEIDGYTDPRLARGFFSEFLSAVDSLGSFLQRGALSMERPLGANISPRVLLLLMPYRCPNLGLTTGGGRFDRVGGLPGVRTATTCH